MRHMISQRRVDPILYKMALRALVDRARDVVVRLSYHIMHIQEKKQDNDVQDTAHIGRRCGGQTAHGSTVSAGVCVVMLVAINAVFKGKAGWAAAFMNGLVGA